MCVGVCVQHVAMVLCEHTECYRLLMCYVLHTNTLATEINIGIMRDECIVINSHVHFKGTE